MVDGSGNVYLMGQTSSTDFPTTAGAFQSVYGGGTSDSFVTKLVTADPGNPVADAGGPYVFDEGTTGVILDGGASSDPDGT